MRHPSVLRRPITRPLWLALAAVLALIYGGITGSSPVGLPSRVVTHRGYTLEIAPTIAALLQEAASAALGTGGS